MKSAQYYYSKANACAELGRWAARDEWRAMAKKAVEIARRKAQGERARLDRLTRSLTAFDSFQGLLDAPGGYFPSLKAGSYPHTVLAKAYDTAQAKRGDSRRAFRG